MLFCLLNTNILFHSTAFFNVTCFNKIWNSERMVEGNFEAYKSFGFHAISRADMLLEPSSMWHSVWRILPLPKILLGIFTIFNSC